MTADKPKPSGRFGDAPDLTMPTLGQAIRGEYGPTNGSITNEDLERKRHVRRPLSIPAAQRVTDHTYTGKSEFEE